MDYNIQQIITELKANIDDIQIITKEEEIKPFTLAKWQTLNETHTTYLYVPRKCVISLLLCYYGCEFTVYKCQPRGEIEFITRQTYRNIEPLLQIISGCKAQTDNDIAKAQKAQTERAQNAWVETGNYEAVLAGIRKYKIKLYHQDRSKSIQDPEANVQVKIDIWYDKGGTHENKRYISCVPFDIENVKFLNDIINQLPNAKECAKEILEHIKDVS